jgi:hypothetical protein
MYLFSFPENSLENENDINLDKVFFTQNQSPLVSIQYED